VRITSPLLASVDMIRGLRLSVIDAGRGSPSLVTPLALQSRHSFQIIVPQRRCPGRTFALVFCSHQRIPNRP